jgi:hypothetical protein
MAPGQTVANLVVVKLGTDGAVGLYNNAGNTNLLADVVAWSRADGHFVGLSPARVLDTRAGTPVAPGGTIDVPVRGVGGVPGTGVGTVVVNITATRPTSPTYLTVWPSGANRPDASSLNATLDQTVANLVFAPVGANGSISIFNERGTTDVLVDVVGYVADGAAYVPLNPVRVMDTRIGLGNYGVLQSNLALSKPFGRLGANQTFTLDLDNQLSASLDGTGLTSVAGFVFNVTAVDPTTAGYLTVYPGGTSRPEASNINLAAGSIVPNAVVVKPGPYNLVGIYNETGTVHVLVDLVGYVPLQNSLDNLDSTGGSKFHVLYVQGSDSSTNPADQATAIGQIRNEVATLDGWFAQPAQAGRHLNLDQAAGQIEITTVRYDQFTKARLVNWDSEAGFPILRQLSDDGFGNGQNRRWLVYFDGDRAALLPGEVGDPGRSHVCGIRYFQFTTVFMGNACHDVDGSVSLANFASQSNAGLVALHEMLHGLGAVPSCAPHYTSFGGGHVGGTNGSFDDSSFGVNNNPERFDLMFPYAGYLPKQLDIGRDDYFGHSNPACLDIADSPFIAGSPSQVVVSR